MTDEPIDDGKEFQFEHPENILTADAAIARADAIVQATRDSDGPRLAFLIAKALLEAWQEGATFGSDESVTMASRVIQRATDRALDEVLKKTLAGPHEN